MSALAVVAVVGMVVAMDDQGSRRSAVATRSTGEAEAPAEPLFIVAWHQELLMDGTLVDLPRAEEHEVPAGRPVRLDDGRLLTVVRSPSVPGTPDGPVVLRVFGEVLLASHELHPGGSGEIVDLVGAGANEAVLMHTTAMGGCCVRLSELNLDTGRERTLVETSNVPHSRTHAHVADYGNGKVIFVSPVGTGTCRIQSVELDSGAESASDPFACVSPRAAAIGPDGDRAAVVYGDVDGDPRLAIIDLATGAVLSEHTLGTQSRPAHTATTSDCELSDLTDQFSDLGLSDYSEFSFSDFPDVSDRSGTVRPLCDVSFGPELTYLGMAWTNRSSLRVALLESCCGTQPQIETYVID